MLKLILLAVIASLVLFLLGMGLRGRGYLTGRGIALAWALLTVLPVIGGGAALFIGHQVERADGITRANHDTPAGVYAP